MTARRCALLGDELGDLDSQAIVTWGEGEAILPGGKVRIIADVLALAALATLLGWVAIGTGPIPFVVIVLLEGLFTLWIGKKVRQTLEPLKEHAAELARLGKMLRMDRDRAVYPRRDCSGRDRPSNREPSRRRSGSRRWRGSRGVWRCVKMPCSRRWRRC